MVINTEGHESSIIPSIEFNQIGVENIYFESHTVGVNKSGIYEFLKKNNYEINELGGDSVASRISRNNLN